MGKAFKVVFIILQWTWGIVQNLCGLAVFLMFSRRERLCRYGAAVTVWNERGASLSLGMFIFIARYCPKDGSMTYEQSFDRTLVHEYGHSVQSLILGPLYLPVIGLPSVIWAGLPAFGKMRRGKKVSYFSFYTERLANYLGEKVTGDISMGQAII